MKHGISETMWVIVSALVVLVVAIVILTMFTTTAVNVGRFVEHCRTSAATTCQSTAGLPVGWDTTRMRTDAGDKTCSEATGIKDCSMFRSQ